MAKTYTWPDGSKNHSITWEQHTINKAGGLNPTGNPSTLKGLGTSQLDPTGGATSMKGLGGTSIPLNRVGTGEGPTTNPLIEGVYNDAASGAGTQYNNTIAGITYGEDSLVKDFFGIDPGGAVRNADGYLDPTATEALGVNPNDPFSKMALLSRSYQQEQDRSKNNYAAMGQFHSGAYGRAVLSDQFNNDQSKDQLFKAFETNANQSKQARLTASDTKTTALGGAANSRLNSYLGGS